LRFAYLFTLHSRFSFRFVVISNMQAEGKRRLLFPKAGQSTKGHPHPLRAIETLQRTAAPLGIPTVREDLLATVAADRAFPAAVAELGR
jgi:hypothetical protein